MEHSGSGAFGFLVALVLPRGEVAAMRLDRRDGSTRSKEGVTMGASGIAGTNISSVRTCSSRRSSNRVPRRAESRGPPGRWVDLFEGRSEVTGPAEVEVAVTLEELPAFAGTERSCRFSLMTAGR